MEQLVAASLFDGEGVINFYGGDTTDAIANARGVEAPLHEPHDDRYDHVFGDVIPMMTSAIRKTSGVVAPTHSARTAYESRHDHVFDPSTPYVAIQAARRTNRLGKIGTAVLAGAGLSAAAAGLMMLNEDTVTDTAEGLVTLSKTALDNTLYGTGLAYGFGRSYLESIGLIAGPTKDAAEYVADVDADNTNDEPEDKSSAPTTTQQGLFSTTSVQVEGQVEDTPTQPTTQPRQRARNPSMISKAVQYMTKPTVSKRKPKFKKVKKDRKRINFRLPSRKKPRKKRRK